MRYLTFILLTLVLSCSSRNVERTYSHYVVADTVLPEPTPYEYGAGTYQGVPANKLTWFESADGTGNWTRVDSGVYTVTSYILIRNYDENLVEVRIDDKRQVEYLSANGATSISFTTRINDDLYHMVINRRGVLVNGDEIIQDSTILKRLIEKINGPI